MKGISLRKNEYPGKLIVFEGTDGAGKSTMVSMTSEFLKTLNETVISIKQPTDLSRKTKLFQKMMYCEDHSDIDYRAVQLLTMSDRVQHAHEVIEPALKEGKTVICDRYVYTSLANMLARGYDNEKWFYEVAQYIIRPNYIFLAYAPPELAIQRIKQRADEKDRFLDENLLINVAKEFLNMAERENFIVLDTTRDSNTAFKTIRKTLR